MKKWAILPDAHLETKASRPYSISKAWVKDYKPNGVILLGDYANVSALTHWDQDKRKKMEGKRHEREMKFVKQELRFLSDHCDEIIWILGNHEAWIEQYTEKHPEMTGLVEIENLIDLKSVNTKLITQDKMYKLGHCYFTHGFWTTKYHANKHLTALGCNVVYGHTHRPQTDMLNMKMQKPIMAYGLGCLCDHGPSYLKNKPANWMCQVAEFLLDKGGNFSVIPHNIVDNKMIYNGKVYRG